MSAIQRPESRLRSLPIKVIPLKPSEKTLPVKDLKNNSIIFKLMSKIDDEEYINLMNSKSKAINQQHNANSRESKSKSKSKVQGTEASNSKASNSKASNSKASNSKASNSKASNSKAPGTLTSSSRASKVPGTQTLNSNLETPKRTLLQKIKIFLALRKEQREKKKEYNRKKKILKQERNILMSDGYDTREDIHFLKELRGLLPPRTFLNSKWVAN
jgi:hypothetical protein